MKRSFKFYLACGLVALLSAGLSSSLMAQDEKPFAEQKFVLQLSDMDPDKQTLVLNNASNILKYYGEDKADVEIVAYGPGLHMLRADTSPVKDRLKDYAPSFPNVTFAACGNTIKGMTKKEGKAPTLISSDSISVVPSGVVQLIARQDQGWHYIRP